MAKKKSEVVMRECDYCGEEFPEELMNQQAADEDHCVCPSCVGCHEQYMVAMGERESELDEDELDEECEFFEIMF